jgi:hypothetical protein
MIDAIHLFHLARGPLRSLARHWMCRGLRRAALAGNIDRYCGACDVTKTNDGRAIAIGKS